MAETRRWVLVVVAAVLILALVALARGPEHRRGQQVGAVGRTVHVTASGV